MTKEKLIDKITLKDVEEAAEKVFIGEQYPKKLANNWWQLSPNCWCNNATYEEFCRIMKDMVINKRERQSIVEWRGSNGLKISFKNDSDEEQ